ncbi:hypothetical protein MHW47_00165 [Streptomyces sp. OfavH-34-F]|uniref:hypothetical protein n=1 Tax=Streptomyces sp. OfavH-34-F TaxID=2917760 RepID=UPI001EF349E5|nr:hypothetical protein [Streptomyces sp. OfavH-34-F]MCG7522869.1 hypothetical protein [Streptomyces sp. OfavH-34-F]
MAVIAFSGASGGPGVTATALAALLTWPLTDGRRAILAECDPDGGSIAAGYLESRLLGEYGLHNLEVAHRRRQLDQDFWYQLIDVSDKDNQDRLLLPGLSNPAQAAGLSQVWQRLGLLFDQLQSQDPGYDVLVDLGRSGATGSASALARSADIVAVVVRRTLRSASAAKPRVEALRAALEDRGRDSGRLGLVVIEEGNFRPRDIAEQLELPIFATLPHDPRAAQILSHGGDGGRYFGRSALLREARAMSEQLRGLAMQERQRLLAPALRPQTVLDRMKGAVNAAR